MGSIGQDTNAGDLNWETSFPSDVPTAPLRRLSLNALLSQDQATSKAESLRFFEACTTLGFFYLDVRGTDFAGSILDDVESLFKVEEELFALPEDEKRSYDFVAQGKETYFGYKPMGASVIDKDGNKDRNEFFNVSKDDIFGISDPWPAPSVLQHHRELQKRFISSAHKIAALLLSHLDTHCHFQPGTLENLHRLTAVSGDQIRLTHTAPQPEHDRRMSLGAHTDFGSVTILFNRLGGLQVLPPDQEEWCYVRPLASHAIVNLGDALVKFTNGLLRSNIHRVVNPPGEQSMLERYSLMYFMRPEDDVILCSLGGKDGNGVIKGLEGQEEEKINSKDWIMRRVKARGRGVKQDIRTAAQSQWDQDVGTEGTKV